MNRLRTSLSRSSSLARVSVVALVAALLSVTPVASAQAAQAESDGLATDDAPLTWLGAQLTTRRDDAAQQLREVVRRAVDRSAHRVTKVEERVELVLTFGYGYEGLLLLDDSAFAPVVDEPVVEGRERGRLEVEITDDPLAGM